MYKELNSIKTNNLILKWANEEKLFFPKEDIRIANRYKERYAMSLIIREMQVETTMRGHLLTY